MTQNSEEQKLLLFDSENGKTGKKAPVKWIVVLAVIAAAVIAVFVFANGSGGPEVDADQFAQGVRVLDCDLSGMTMAAAQEAAAESARQKIEAEAVTYTVGGKEYSIGGAQAGMEIDFQKALEEAFRYGKSGDRQKDREALQYAAEAGMVFPCEITVDEALVRNEVSKNLPDAGGSGISGSSIKTTADEETKTTGYQVSQAQAGAEEKIDEEKLVADISEAMRALAAGPVAAVSVETAEAGPTAIETISSYETKIEHPELDSAYNIWKASDLLNATEIKPGEVWSMKEALGALDTADGWKNANELIDGKIQSVAGGGLNHLASTIYAAALQSGVTVEQRVKRPWPATYIDAGLDADIFSEDADLKIKNDADTSVFLVIECKAAEGTLTASFLGMPYEDGLQREVVSEITAETNDLGGVTAEVALRTKDEDGAEKDTRKLYEDKYQAEQQ